jgi:hypothetical protein
MIQVIFSPEKSAPAWTVGTAITIVHAIANTMHCHFLISKPPSHAFCRFVNWDFTARSSFLPPSERSSIVAKPRNIFEQESLQAITQTN